jgi:uncharacterized protein (TIGR02597 family)
LTFFSTTTNYRSMNSSGLSSLRLAAAIALATAGSSFAQTTATTDPVGFITLNVAGTGGAANSTLSFAGLSMTRAVEYQGSAETLGTNTVTDNEATWTDDQFNGASGSYFLEISGGPGAGTTYDITGTSAANKRITLAQNLAAGVTAPVSFKVRKHWTIASVFGANNEGGLQGGNATTADNVRIYNGSSYDTYYYSTGGLAGTGWRKIGSNPANADQANILIYPDDGLLVSRQQSGAANIVLLGSVKTGQTSFPVLPGLNIVSNPYAAPMTLESSGLRQSGLTGGNSTTADSVRIYNGSSYDTYYYSTGGLAGTGWRKIGSNPANLDQQNVQIPVGVSVLITRVGASGFDWKAPQHPASL